MLKVVSLTFPVWGAFLLLIKHDFQFSLITYTVLVVISAFPIWYMKWDSFNKLIYTLMYYSVASFPFFSLHV